MFGDIFKAIGPIIQILSVGLAPTLKLLSLIVTSIVESIKWIFTLGKSGFAGTKAAASAYGDSVMKPFQMVGLAQEPQQVQDGIVPPGNGPFKITNRFNETAITAGGDGIAVSPNIKTSSGGNQSSGIDYERLGSHLANAISKVQVQTNLDGVAVSRGLQTPMGQTTRKI
jgi:hypothetical protein